MLPQGFPAALEVYLQARFGVVRASTPLTLGQSGAQVFKVTFEQGSLIVKSTRNSREPSFYANYAPALRAAGVPIPALEWSGKEGGLYWLALEYVPVPLPRERWLAEPLVMSALRTLHSINAPTEPDPALFQPKWTANMNRAAAELSGADPGTLLARLEALREANTDLFQPLHFISGDPNPTNWGLRSDGKAVLFDWERFGLGTPPLDLAISMPGLSSNSDCTRVAEVYLSIAIGTITPYSSAEVLAEKIAAAKVWNVVEYISFAIIDHAQIDPERVKSLAGSLPGWIDGLIGR